MPENYESGDWNEYKQRVLYQLQTLTNQAKELSNKVDKMREDIIILKIKAWAFGVFGGTIVTLIIQVILNLLAKKG